jgi:hypothetical protein
MKYLEVQIKFQQTSAFSVRVQPVSIKFVLKTITWFIEKKYNQFMMSRSFESVTTTKSLVVSVQIMQLSQSSYVT